MRFDKTSRRLFLTGLGGATLAIPLLPSLLPKALRPMAKAQEEDPPRRFVAIKTYNGARVLDWYPMAKVGYETRSVDGTLVADQRLSTATGNHSDGGAYYGHYAPLTDLVDGGISNIFGPAMMPFIDQMNLFRGLDFMPGLNHNYGGYLGNFGLNTNGTGGPVAGAQINATIDHVMAQSGSLYPMAPSGPRVLHVGSRANTSSYAPGSAGGQLRTGRYVDYTDWDRPIRFRQHDGSVIEGVQFNRLLVTIMQAMGLSPDEYEREPGRGFGEYRPVGKGDGFARDYDETNVGEPLPDLFVG